MDYTSGSTGSSLEMVCANRGYRAYFVSSDAFVEEKLQTMRAFGAELDIPEWKWKDLRGAYRFYGGKGKKAKQGSEFFLERSIQ